MIKIYKPSGSMRSNYRPLEFLICLSLTLGCLWSSAFIKSSMWLGWLIGMGLRLSPNTIAVAAYVCCSKACRKAILKDTFGFSCRLWQTVSCVDAEEFAVSLLPYCLQLLSEFQPIFNLSFASALSQINTSYTQWKINSRLCILSFYYYY